MLQASMAILPLNPIDMPSAPSAISHQPSGPIPRNRGIDILRGLALISIVLPHLSPHPPEGSAYPVYFSLLEAFCSLGVPLFFAISGFLFRGSLGRPWPAILKRRYLLPWLLASVAFWAAEAVRPGGSASLVAWAGIFSGYASIYYFLTLLFVFEMITWKLIRCGANLNYVLPAAGLIGLAATAGAGMRLASAPAGIFTVSRFCTYLNPLCFYVYYLLGLWLSGPGSTDLLRRFRGAVFLAAPVFLAAKFAETWQLVRSGHYSLVYFSPAAMLMAVSLIGLLTFVLSGQPCRSRIFQPLVALGAYALPIYLYHLGPTAVVRAIFERLKIPMFPWHLAGAAAVLAVCYGVCRLAALILPPVPLRLVFGIKKAEG